MDHEASPQAQGDVRAHICRPVGRATGPTTLLVVLYVQLGEGAILCSSSVTANISNVCKILT